jgi:hypothetical protein
MHTFNVAANARFVASIRRRGTPDPSSPACEHLGAIDLPSRIPSLRYRISRFEKFPPLIAQMIAMNGRKIANVETSVPTNSPIAMLCAGLKSWKRLTTTFTSYRAGFRDVIAIFSATLFGCNVLKIARFS